MKVFEVATDTVKLYRGDSSQIEKYSIDETDPMSLFGIGIYLTDDPTIAKDYTLKSSRDVVFPNEREHGNYDDSRDLIVAYLRHIIDKQLKWTETSQEIREKWQKKYWENPKSSDDVKEQYKNEMKDVLQKYLKKAKEIYKRNRKNMRMIRDVLGHYKFTNANRSGQITTFDIPTAYLEKTFHAEQPLTKEILAIIRDLFVKNGWNLEHLDLRIPDEKLGEKRVGFDNFIKSFRKMQVRMPWTELMYGGEGKNPSYDFMKHTYPGETLFRELSVQKEFITELQRRGYVGFEYQGGVRISGDGTRGGGREGQLHRCFVMWNADDVEKFKISNEKITDPEIDNELGKAVRAKSIYNYDKTI